MKGKTDGFIYYLSPSHISAKDLVAKSVLFSSSWSEINMNNWEDLQKQQQQKHSSIHVFCRFVFSSAADPDPSILRTENYFYKNY